MSEVPPALIVRSKYTILAPPLVQPEKDPTIDEAIDARYWQVFEAKQDRINMGGYA